MVQEVVPQFPTPWVPPVVGAPTPIRTGKSHISTVGRKEVVVLGTGSRLSGGQSRWTSP